MNSEGTMWSFGVGSNMDRVALEHKKHVKVLDEAPAILKGWKFGFHRGIPYAEPAFACASPDPNEEIHGLAFLMSAEAMAQLDRQEGGYRKAYVDMQAYDGRILHGFVYTGNHNDAARPSKRYMGVLIKGATQAGLKSEYIQRLKAVPTYAPDAETIVKRNALPAPESLPSITVAELAKHDGSNKEEFPVRVAVMGFVFEMKQYRGFGSHRGRDITTRMMLQFHGISMDDNDDAGRPPYPIIANLTKDEQEYLLGWQDNYNAKGPCVAYLKEYLEQQKSGKSDWKLPLV